MKINIELPDILCPLCRDSMITENLLCRSGIANAEVDYICPRDNTKVSINNVVIKVD